MEECCTCECGNQEWIIFKDKIKCSKCGDKWLFPENILASELVNNFAKE